MLYVRTNNVWPKHHKMDHLESEELDLSPRKEFASVQRRAASSAKPSGKT